MTEEKDIRFTEKANVEKRRKEVSVGAVSRDSEQRKSSVKI